MDRIIKYIKNIFKPKEHTLKDKIEFLLNRNIDVYSDRYNIEFYNFIYKDIISKGRLWTTRKKSFDTREEKPTVLVKYEQK